MTFAPAPPRSRGPRSERGWTARSRECLVTAQQRLGRTFAAVVFDWDGTAVTDRHASA